jgi:hypothetical protein
MEQLEVDYLTNALGEDTGHGTLQVRKADLNKVPFESVPGFILPYIAEIKRRKYVLANLEIAYKDSFWSDNDNYMPLEDAQAYCNRANAFLKGRLTAGALVLPIDNGYPGRIIIGVAIPMAYIKDSDQTSRVITEIFGEKLSRAEDDFE